MILYLELLGVGPVKKNTLYNNSAGNYYRQIKLTHCCIFADGIDFLRVNEAKTLKIGTLKYK